MKFRKSKRFNKPKLPKLTLKNLEAEDSASTQTPSNLPNITNETVAEHREEVIGSARKYIYPLQHSKHRIVLISSGLFIAALVVFFSYCTYSLYRSKSTSGFLYGVTQVIPFPVAKAGSNYVAYENYLFELRHYTHYYTSQQKVDFNSDSGRQQLVAYKQRALDKVINDAYVKQLAKKHKLTVTNKEIDDQIAIVQSQNRLGASDKGLEDVLKDNFGWSLNDFKRSLRQQLLAQKVVANLGTDTQKRADTALAELTAGADFAATAKKYSDDPSRDNGGEFGFAVDKTNRDLSAQTTNALFALKPGQVSGIVNNGYGLEILKNIEAQGDKIRGARILFNFKDISVYTNDLKDKQKSKVYITL